MRETFLAENAIGPSPLYREELRGYERWLQESSAPLLPTTKGLLPGDAAATYGERWHAYRNNRSEFDILQLRGGNYESALLSVRGNLQTCVEVTTSHGLRTITSPSL